MHQVVGSKEISLAPGDLLFTETQLGALAQRQIHVQLTDVGFVVEVGDIAGTVSLVIVIGAHFLQVPEEVGLYLPHPAQLRNERDVVAGFPLQVQPRGTAHHRQLAAIVITGVSSQFFMFHDISWRR